MKVILFSEESESDKDHPPPQPDVDTILILVESEGLPEWFPKAGQLRCLCRCSHGSSRHPIRTEIYILYMHICMRYVKYVAQFIGYKICMQPAGL